MLFSYSLPFLRDLEIIQFLLQIINSVTLKNIFNYFEHLFIHHLKIKLKLQNITSMALYNLSLTILNSLHFCFSQAHYYFSTLKLCLQTQHALLCISFCFISLFLICSRLLVKVGQLMFGYLFIIMQEPYSYLVPREIKLCPKELQGIGTLNKPEILSSLPC